ncbi:hypothetical protein BS17DRAFT_798697 [Gyrodon lividus]|nr:hypothetical protein BS17DRAFT_798697 [Gyrodon lividus]
MYLYFRQLPECARPERKWTPPAIRSSADSGQVLASTDTAMSPPTSTPPQLPVPFADFEYAFDPALSNLFSPTSIPLPASADLFSPSETTDLLGFLDNFNWDFEVDPSLHDVPCVPVHPSSASLPLADNIPALLLDPLPITFNKPPEVPGRSTPSESRSRTRSARREGTSDPRQTARTRPLLSTPQKRLNHIMSEQKRRNAIRDGYAQLISLIAPAGTQTIDLPSRGRPKGSGTRSKGQTKGKSGVLFRAVEYCKWLEEGRDALKEEVLLFQAAAGIRALR